MKDKHSLLKHLAVVMACRQVLPGFLVPAFVETSAGKLGGPAKRDKLG